MLDSIRAQGKLDAALEARILAADSKARLEDIYLPYKPKRRTKAMIARENGLEPLADALLADPTLDPTDDRGGLRHRERPRRRRGARGRPRDPRRALRRGRRPHRRAARAHVDAAAAWSRRVREGKETDGREVRRLLRVLRAVHARCPRTASSRCSAGRRRRSSTSPSTRADGRSRASRHRLRAHRSPPRPASATRAARPTSGWPSVVRWAWRTRILLAPAGSTCGCGCAPSPRRPRSRSSPRTCATCCSPPPPAPAPRWASTRACAPASRSPSSTPPARSSPRTRSTRTSRGATGTGALATLAELAAAHDVDLIAIGNGTASRETDKLAGELVAANPGLKMTKVMVSEAGASVYSASAYASAELPGPRRLAARRGVHRPPPAGPARRAGQDRPEVDRRGPVPARPARVVAVPLAGRRRRGLRERRRRRRQHRLGAAPAPRLGDHRRRSPRTIVAHRDAHGPFRTRTALTDVPRLGPKAFEQCAGFLRIRGGDDPLDVSGVHPEAYPVVRRIVAKAGGGRRGAARQRAAAAVAQAAAVRRRPVRAADGHRHPRRAGEARPRPAPGVPHRDLRRGRPQDRRPAAGDGARGRGHERRRVRRVRRRRGAPGRARARLGDVAAVRRATRATS